MAEKIFMSVEEVAADRRRGCGYHTENEEKQPDYSDAGLSL